MSHDQGIWLSLEVISHVNKHFPMAFQRGLTSPRMGLAPLAPWLSAPGAGVEGEQWVVEGRIPS